MQFLVIRSIKNLIKYSEANIERNFINKCRTLERYEKKVDKFLEKQLI